LAEWVSQKSESRIDREVAPGPADHGGHLELVVEQADRMRCGTPSSMARSAKAMCFAPSSQANPSHIKWSEEAASRDGRRSHGQTSQKRRVTC
jgi:hypothetical protein